MNVDSTPARDKRARAKARRLTRITLVGGLAAGTLLTGCSLPHLADMGSPKVSSHAKSAVAHPAAPTPKPTPTPTPSSVAATPVAAHHVIAGGDLAAGSVTHKLDAGNYKLVANYWTSQDPSTWTADQSAILQLSAHIENGPILSAVKVSRFFATMDDGSAVTTLSDDRGEFILTPPYSYSSALRIHPSSSKATSATVSVEFDLLIETAPMSGQFFRQTVLDTIHLTFAQEGASR